jgi:type II secretory pathway pseudopilin PulG
MGYVITVMVILSLLGINSWRSSQVKKIQAEKDDFLSQATASLLKQQEAYRNSSLAISKSRALLADAQSEIRTLETTLQCMRQSLVALPLPGDMTSAGDKALIYLPRFTYKGEGIAEVIIPGSYCHFPLHVITSEQTSEEREAIYETVRENSAAQRELALRMLWNFID